jgi:Flp pilus assembly protein TadD
MKTTRLAGFGWCMTLAFVVGGCGAKKKEVTELQRKESAHHASEAQFALTVRDFARAETSLAKAAELTPDEAALWVNLGAARMKQGKREAAKDAYRRALAVHEGEAKQNKTDPHAWLEQVYVLALLGRSDDARAKLDKAAKAFPDHRDVKAFVEGRQLERILADPKFKETAL